MKTTKGNRWSNYKPAQTPPAAVPDFVRPPAELTFAIEGGRTQRIEYSFMGRRPQIASILAKVFLVEGKRYCYRTRVAMVCSLRVFNQFLDHRRPEINNTSLFSYELLQEFAAWMTRIRNYPEYTASNHFSCLRRILKAAKAFYPSVFEPNFDIPTHVFSNAKLHRQTSRALPAEGLQRLLIAADKEVADVLNHYREGDVPEGLRTLIPFMILISAKTAINPQSLYNIRRDCLIPHVLDTNACYVRWTKWRSKSGVQQQLHYADPKGRGVIEMLQFLINYTQPLVERAKEYDRGMLFLYLYRFGGDRKGVAAAKKSDANNQALRAFCERNGLPEISMVQLRPSAATHHYIKTGGKLRKVQLLLGHTNISTTQRYIGDALVRSLHNKSIRTAQKALVERVTTVVPKVAKQALADLVEELSSEQLEQIAGGEYDTGIGKCRDPFNSPQPGQLKGKCCTLFLACLTCPNALFFLEDLPRVIALRDYFMAERENMRRGVWEVLYQDKITVIEDDIIGAFSESQVAEARILSVKVTDINVFAAREVPK